MEVDEGRQTALLKEEALVNRAIHAQAPFLEMPIQAFSPVRIPIFANSVRRSPHDPCQGHRQPPPCLSHGVELTGIRALGQGLKPEESRFSLSLRWSELPVSDLVDEVVSRPKTLVHTITAASYDFARGQWTDGGQPPGASGVIRCRLPGCDV